MLIEHHVKYKEIHGIDETVWMEKGKHYTLHNQLRKEGRCKIAVDDLKRISAAAQRRTTKRKKQNHDYHEKIKHIIFYETLDVNIRLQEHLTYNQYTGTIGWSAIFIGTNHHIIKEVCL